jgi:hypothetical protein
LTEEDADPASGVLGTVNAVRVAVCTPAALPAETLLAAGVAAPADDPAAPVTAAVPPVDAAGAVPVPGVGGVAVAVPVAVPVVAGTKVTVSLTVRDPSTVPVGPTTAGMPVA